MGILRRAARTAGRTALITSVATNTHASVAARQRGRSAEQTAQPPRMPASAAAAGTDTTGPDTSTSISQQMLDQLRQLGELRDAGILTTAEFETEKSKTLRT